MRGATKQARQRYWEARQTGVSASSISSTSSTCMAVGDYVAGGMTHTWAGYDVSK